MRDQKELGLEKDFAAGVMFYSANKVLLLRRVKDGLWAFPAGKVDPGEDAQMAAIRECEEEIGQRPGDPRFHSKNANGFSLFLCRSNEFIPTLNPEHDAYVWADKNNLPSPLHRGIRDVLGVVAMDSARDMDENGYITIENNPITRVGVFPYLGSSISPDLEPNTIFYVFRSAEELADPECIESFKMLPLINDHAMLGPEEEGFIPPEKKGVEGIIGEAVAFRDNILYATLKIFSRTLAALIENGKKALSLGYRCRYEYQPGIFAGQAYTFVQRSLRGNHIALVDAARSDVAVLDEKRITLDHFDLNLEERKPMPGEKELSEKVAAQDAQIKALTDENLKLKTALDESEKEKEKDAEDESEEEKKEKKAEDEKQDNPNADKDKKAEDESEEEEKKKDKDAMDAASKKIEAMDAEIQGLKKNGMKALISEVSRRDSLASKLIPHIGVFDHSDKTLDEVAAYGIEKLKLSCPKGHEQTALDAFLLNRPLPGSAPERSSYAQDGGGNVSRLGNYLKKSA